MKETAQETTRGYNSLPEVLTVREIAHYLRIGKSLAYDLARRKDFPAIRLGRTVRVHRDAFLRWLQEQKNTI